MMSQFLNKSLSNSQKQLTTSVSHLPHRLLSFFHDLQPAPLSTLLKRVEEATTSSQLIQAVNSVQKQLWALPRGEQTLWREKLQDSLDIQVHYAATAAIRLEAAGWLRLLTQAGLIAHPEKVFVTLVTAATHLDSSIQAEGKEQQSYLRLIFECFWPFRYPSPAFTWQQFPENALFYPLAPLLDNADSATQEALLLIFSELPRLDDARISSYLLPVALTWARDVDPERRHLVAHVLARMSHESAQEALCQLQADSNPQVRASVKYATN